MTTFTISIIELILKGTAILLAGYGGAALLARSSASLRSLWWLGVFVTLLALPLAPFVRPVWTLSVPAGPEAERTAALPQSGRPGLDASILDTAPASNPSGWRHFSFRQWLLAGYGCGVVGVLGFRLLGSGQLWRLRRAAVGEAEAQFMVDRWRKISRVRRPVRVLTSSRVTAPLTWGACLPVIVCPEACRDWPPEAFAAAMEHEFAHIRHCDAARRWLETIVRALWWPHPLAWLAARAWRLEQERACDDAVLNSGRDPSGYAKLLLTAARHLNISRFQTAAALIMAMPAGLEARLCSIMSQAVDRSAARFRSYLGIGMMTWAAIAGGMAFQAQSVGAAPEGQAPVAETLEKKARETILPQIELRLVTPREALESIASKANLSIVYTPGQEDNSRITLELTGVPASEALKDVAGLSGIEITYTDRLVVAKGKNPKPGGVTLEMRGIATVIKPESAAMKKAQKIIIPAIDFREATLSEALDFLRVKAMAIDPEKRGVTITLQPGSDIGARITMKLNSVPLDEALYYVAGLANLELHAEPNAVVLTTPNAGETKPEQRQP